MLLQAVSDTAIAKALYSLTCIRKASKGAYFRLFNSAFGSAGFDLLRQLADDSFDPEVGEHAQGLLDALNGPTFG